MGLRSETRRRRGGTLVGAGQDGLRPLRVVVVEGFWGGSHRAAAEGWAARSCHEISIESLPARFWKWRMRGAAFEFARRLVPRLDAVDVLFATDLLDLAHLLALLPRRVPSVLYFHENQVAYPPRPGETPEARDLGYAFTNLASALAASGVAFNSEFQKKACLEALDRLVRRMPDARPRWAVRELERRSCVLPLGVSLSDIPPRQPPDGGPPIVVWNHRWEHDKDPETLFRVLVRLVGRGAAFRAMILGERFARAPVVFERAKAKLGERVIAWGFVPDRAAYVACLARADVAVSTARQENFGLGLLEAAYAGAHPLAPNRLSYPEVVPRAYHGLCLYEDEEDLTARLEGLLNGRVARLPPAALRESLAPCDWGFRAPVFDEWVSQVFREADLCYKG